MLRSAKTNPYVYVGMGPRLERVAVGREQQMQCVSW